MTAPSLHEGHQGGTRSKYCPRGQHRGTWEHGSPPLDRFTDGSGWGCPGVMADGSPCGYELRTGAASGGNTAGPRERAAEAWHQFLATAVSDGAEPHEVFAWAYMAGWAHDKWPDMQDIVPPPDVTKGPPPAVLAAENGKRS